MTSIRPWISCCRKSRSRTPRSRHLRDGTLVLYDVSSATFAGWACPLDQIGNAPDGVCGRLQIVYRVLTSTGGIPVAVHVFKGRDR